MVAHPHPSTETIVKGTVEITRATHPPSVGTPGASTSQTHRYLGTAVVPAEDQFRINQIRDLLAGVLEFHPNQHPCLRTALFDYRTALRDLVWINFRTNSAGSASDYASKIR